MKRFALFFALFALFLGCDNSVQSSDSKPQKATYDLISMESKKLTFMRDGDNLRTQSANPYLLVFLTSWCDYCLGQAQHIANINADFSGRLDIYGIFVDKDEDIEKLKKFIEDSGTKFEWFYKGDIAKLARNYSFENLPFMMLYDKNGALKSSYDGLTPEEMIAFDIKRVLGE